MLLSIRRLVFGDRDGDPARVQLFYHLCALLVRQIPLLCHPFSLSSSEPAFPTGPKPGSRHQRLIGPELAPRAILRVFLKGERPAYH